MKYDKPIIFSVRISGDKEIQELNKKHFNRDYPTDVLSFNMNEERVDENGEEYYYLGDLLVNKDEARRQASDYDNDLEHEIAELIEHGSLHLMGIHHDDDDEDTVHGIPTAL